jgi:hypothetical protein
MYYKLVKFKFMGGKKRGGVKGEQGAGECAA